MISVFWIIFSYLIGSVPFAFIISKYSCGVDIRKQGRKQTGATSTFKNAGKWQGILTGILDILKGWLVVVGARKLGLPLEVQALSGLFAVVGHNWPCWLKFFGGRGSATALGAVFALNQTIFAFSFIPFIILTLLWDGAVGTILFLFSVLFLSIKFQQFIPLGIFSILLLIVILIKRLTGIRKELPKSKSKAKLIFNRLLLDRSENTRPFPKWRKKYGADQ